MKDLIISYYRNFKKSDFSISVFKLFTGTATGQLIAVALAPVLYRLYEPESFGVFALFVATSSILGTFSTFQYLQLVLLEKKNEYAERSEHGVRSRLYDDDAAAVSHF